MNSDRQQRFDTSTAFIALLLISSVLAIGAFVYSSTTRVTEALAEEILEQQYDVANLLHDFNGVLIALERNRSERTSENRLALLNALNNCEAQLLTLRSTYTFARLDGAAIAHAFVSPIIADVKQWLNQGIYDYPGNHPSVLSIATKRMTERYDTLREIAAEADRVAVDLIAEQSDYLGRFRNAAITMLSAFALLAMGIAALLVRQRNLEVSIGAERELKAQELISAETRGRQSAEQKLLGSEKFLRATIDSLPAKIAILNNDATIAEVNAAWRDSTISTEQNNKQCTIGQNFQDVLQSTAQTPSEEMALDDMSKAVNAVLDSKQDYAHFDYPVFSNDAQQQWTSMTVSSFETANQRHAVLSLEDISKRKELEEQDRQLRAELAHVARLTTAGELATGLAHELNQPLTAITHNCDAILSDVKTGSETDAEYVDTLNDIYEQAQRAGGIIRGMRHLVKKGNGNKVPIDINELVRETLRLTGQEAREKGIHVQMDLADNLPKPVVDPIQIQQVLVNLERNSVEAMWQHKSEKRELSISTRQRDSNFIQISVQDTGPGVSTEFSQHLYTAFQTTKEDGMGLGLSISRTIVDDHGGKLWHEKSPEGDTIFHFTVACS